MFGLLCLLPVGTAQWPLAMHQLAIKAYTLARSRAAVSFQRPLAARVALPAQTAAQRCFAAVAEAPASAWRKPEEAAPSVPRYAEVDFGGAFAAAPPAASTNVSDVSSSSSPVKLRDGAVRKLRKLQETQQASMLRLMVSSGGCSGYSYEFSLVDSAEGEDDIIVEREGVSLVVDEVSLSFLEDCEVDYVEEMIRSSFQVVKNGLADSKCGCGSSFSLSAF